MAFFSLHPYLFATAIISWKQLRQQKRFTNLKCNAFICRIVSVFVLIIDPIFHIQITCYAFILEWRHQLILCFIMLSWYAFICWMERAILIEILFLHNFWLPYPRPSCSKSAGWFMFRKSHVLWKLKAVPMFHNACMFQICWTMFSVCVCVCSVCVCVCVWGSEIFTFGWSSLARGGARILPSVTPTLSVLFIEPCTLPYICVVCIVDSQHSVYFSL